MARILPLDKAPFVQKCLVARKSAVILPPMLSVFQEFFSPCFARHRNRRADSVQLACTGTVNTEMLLKAG
jgi:hypothetical protein